MRNKVIALIGLSFLLMASALAQLASTVAVSPAVLSLRGPAGKMHTQTFRVTNLTQNIYTFKVEVADVIVEGGKRRFVPAGLTDRGLASLTTVHHNEVRLGPGEEFSIPVTFMMPAESRVRAVAVFFRGVPEQLVPSQRRILLNVGAVVDFSLTNEVILDAVATDVLPQTATSSATVRQQLANIGPEPTIVRGVAAFLDGSGKLVGKTVFEQKRLLPGERSSVVARYGGTLARGRYRVVLSLEYSGETLTNSTELVIP
jgi:hypothetical protein